MAKNWAIVVGINKYNPNNFARLKYAKRDAELMRDFFRHEAKFDEVYYFADDSPDVVRPDGAEIPTYPSCGNLLSFLHDRFERPFLSAGDNLWFFFAGHGGRYGDRDYLMPIDANPRGSEPTAAILVSDVRDRLCRCGADNVILILDACRNEGSRSSPGIGTEAQQGVITISACSPTQKSWEIDEIQQGAFTKALLEALQIPGERNCATVERLEQYLHFRVPQLCSQYGKFPEQNPRISVDPATKLHFILLPQYATLTDVAVLKNDAYRAAQVDKNLELAEQLWRRIIAVTYGRDEEALQAFSWIRQQREERSSSAEKLHSGNEESKKRFTSTNAPPSNKFKKLASIPWIWLAGSLSCYVICGFQLANLAATPSIWSWGLGLVSAIATNLVMSENSAFSVAVTLTAAMGLAAAVAENTAVPGEWAVVLVGAVAGTFSEIVITPKLLKFFSKLHSFLFLMATASAGLIIGLLMHSVHPL